MEVSIKGTPFEFSTLGHSTLGNFTVQRTMAICPFARIKNLQSIVISNSGSPGFYWGQQFMAGKTKHDMYKNPYSAYKQKEQRRRTQSYRATTPEIEKNTKALYKVNPIAIQ
jgi:hypothetical protein